MNSDFILFKNDNEARADFTKIIKARERTVKLRNSIIRGSVNKSLTCPLPRSIFDESNNFRLTGHQIVAGQLVSNLSPGESALVRSSTGSGKTMMIWEMVRQLHYRWPNGRRNNEPNLIIVCTDFKELKNAEKELSDKYIRALGSNVNYSSKNEKEKFKNDYINSLKGSKYLIDQNKKKLITKETIEKMLDFVNDAAPPSYLNVDILPNNDTMIKKEKKHDQELENKKRWWYWNRVTRVMPSSTFTSWKNDNTKKFKLDESNQYQIQFRGEGIGIKKIYHGGVADPKIKYKLLRDQVNAYFDKAAEMLDVDFDPQSLTMSSYISMLMSFCRWSLYEHEEIFRGVGAKAEVVLANNTNVVKGRFVNFKITVTSGGKNPVEYYGPFYFVQGRIGNRVKLLRSLYGGGLANIKIPGGIDEDITKPVTINVGSNKYKIEIDHVWKVTSLTENGQSKKFDATAFMTSNHMAMGAQVSIQYPIIEKMLQHYFHISELQKPDNRGKIEPSLTWWMTLASNKHKRNETKDLSFESLRRTNKKVPHNNPRTIVLGMTRDALVRHAANIRNAVLILDESHEITKKTDPMKSFYSIIRKTIMRNKEKNDTNYIVGLTATPYTNGRKSLIRHIKAISGKSLSKRTPVDDIRRKINELGIKIFWYDMTLDAYRIPTIGFGVNVNTIENNKEVQFNDTIFRVKLPTKVKKQNDNLCLLQKSDNCAKILEKSTINTNKKVGKTKNKINNAIKINEVEIQQLTFFTKSFPPRSIDFNSTSLKNIYKHESEFDTYYILVRSKNSELFIYDNNKKYIRLNVFQYKPHHLMIQVDSKIKGDNELIAKRFLFSTIQSAKTIRNSYNKILTNFNNAYMLKNYLGGNSHTSSN